MSGHTGASEAFKGTKVNNNFRKDIQVKDSIFVALAQGQDVVCLRYNEAFQIRGANQFPGGPKPYIALK